MDKNENNKNPDIQAAFERIKVSKGKLTENELRNLCRLTEGSGMPIDALCQQLRDAGVKAFLVRDLRTVLLCQPARLAFLREEPVYLHTALVIVREEISRLVRVILDDPSLDETLENQGWLRFLCTLSTKYGFDPESFRKILVREGLERSRASEIKSILECPDVRDRFVAETDRLCWSAALRLAREQLDNEQRTHEYALKQAARKIIWLLVHKEWPGCADIQSQNAPLSVMREPTGKFTITHAASGKWVLVLKSDRSSHNPNNNTSTNENK